jgi:hypothetical protein
MHPEPFPGRLSNFTVDRIAGTYSVPLKAPALFLFLRFALNQFAPEQAEEVAVIREIDALSECNIPRSIINYFLSGK